LPGLPEAEDGHKRIRGALRQVARDRDYWAGIPMPLDGEQLVIEPNYPDALALMAIGKSEDKDEDNYLLRNTFWSSHKRSDIVVMQHKVTGRIDWGILPGANHLGHDLRTLGCSDAWGIEQESRALELLETLVKPRAFKHYLLTGMFLERSKRSGITYLFRRLKPTVAIHTVKDDSRILCALCMHPIAYYSGSWAGAMVPTDDVVAHLSMMRGDEALFWRRCNQHPAWRPQAGV
jgi:hypothetical protein